MTKRQGQLNRADILQAKKRLEALADSEQAQQGADLIAHALGLSYADSVPQEALVIKHDEVVEVDSQTFNVTPHEKSENTTQLEDRLKPHFWYLARREAAPEKAKKKRKEITKLRAWKNRPANKPKHTPLLSSQALLAKLAPALKQTQAGYKVDIDKVTHTLSRAEYLYRVPKQCQKSQQANLTLIDDRSRYLTCYWHDHFHGCKTLLESRLYPDLTIAVWVDGDEQPQAISPQGERKDWQIQPHAKVLIFSDLGALSCSRTVTEQWLHLGRRLQRKQCQAIVLLPCDIKLVAPNLRRLYQCFMWDHACTQPNLKPDKLLTALAPSIRIEPDLIRAMRLQMQQHGKEWELPASVESLLWQSAAIKEGHSAAATWSPEIRQDYLKAFATLSEAEQSTALSTIRQWRGQLSERIWYEEILSLDKASQNHDCIKDDVQQALAYFEALDERFANQAELQNDTSGRAWLKRFYQRIPKKQIENSSTLQRLTAKVYQDEEDFDNQYINPQNLDSKEQPIQQAVIYQQGQYLYLKPYTPFDLPDSGYSPIALIKCQHEYVQVLMAGQALGDIRLNDSQGWYLPAAGRLTIKSDQETLHFHNQTAPENTQMG